MLRGQAKFVILQVPILSFDNSLPCHHEVISGVEREYVAVDSLGTGDVKVCEQVGHGCGVCCELDLTGFPDTLQLRAEYYSLPAHAVEERFDSGAVTSK